MSDELKKCPLCGKDPEVHPPDDGTMQGHLTCSDVNCDAGCWWVPQEKWQTRPIESTLQAKLAVAIEALEGIHSCTCYEGDHKAANPHCEVNIAQDALAKIRGEEMTTEPKPLPCPFCDQELVKTEDNYGIAWKHPYKPGVCIALGIVLGGSGDIAEWNHRPAEMKLAYAIAALEVIQKSCPPVTFNLRLIEIESIARHALKKIRS